MHKPKKIKNFLNLNPNPYRNALTKYKEISENFNPKYIMHRKFFK